MLWAGDQPSCCHRRCRRPSIDGASSERPQQIAHRRSKMATTCEAREAVGARAPLSSLSQLEWRLRRRRARELEWRLQRLSGGAAMQ